MCVDLACRGYVSTCAQFGKLPYPHMETNTMYSVIYTPNRTGYVIIHSEKTLQHSHRGWLEAEEDAKKRRENRPTGRKTMSKALRLARKLKMQHN